MRQMSRSGLEVAAQAVRKLEFTEQEVDDLKANLMRMALKATIIVRSPERTPEGKVKYVEIPDNSIQLAATARALEHAAGKPRQSIAVETPGKAGPSAGLRDLVVLMEQNPDVCLKILGAFQDKLKQAQPIDITSTSAAIPAHPPESQSGASPS